MIKTLSINPFEDLSSNTIKLRAHVLVLETEGRFGMRYGAWIMDMYRYGSNSRYGSNALNRTLIWKGR